MRNLALIIFLLTPATVYAFLGTEMAPLLQLVAGQVQELERLAENLGVAKENQKILLELNDGIQKTVYQIQTIQNFVDRTQNLNPTEVRTLSELNDLLSRTRTLKADIDDYVGVKVILADQTIHRSALQSDNSYRAGQEIVQAGGILATESTRASPGRAAQIGAAAGSAQMLTSGVGLQALAQLVEIQAMSLEFQKMQVERDLRSNDARKKSYLNGLKPGKKRTRE